MVGKPEMSTVVEDGGKGDDNGGQRWHWGVRAAKEFESELKKEPDLAIESPPAEKPVAISEEKKPETKVPSTEENL
ncbi:hypothetical protein Syun_029506 [Stephania yunnanensis]|uniref:Uncharacterized protein n=1 Tax=Stephania yunnanensis TaxID=152371 RepID=A0AAP0E933_9MAGN